MRRITILGATGSIGQSTIDLIKRRPDDFDVVALTGGCNAKQLAADALALRAEIAVVDSADCYGELQDLLSGTGIEVACGAQAIADAARRPADWIMSAIVGAAGLPPGMAALEQGSTLALANKESLVTAGPLLMATAARYGARILPVDSEHSAVFQALVGEPMDAVERVIITASGGAFRDWPLEQLKSATVAQASAHPNWDMGQRITIDSASMFNKALELIETKEYFGISSDKIEAIVHPESLVHALVGFNDGALMAHVGPPDMRHAIGYALNWPDRSHLPVARLDLAAIGALTFRAADEVRWPALRMAREVMAAGGKMGAVFNAAKERALDAFIAGRVGFMDMPAVVAETLAKMSAQSGLQNAPISLEEVMETDRLSRICADAALAKLG
ncbi:1-deoxy-D-xylulose-5-phosphate reductoisomerase [Loktanella sp. TSTF-M6]|uniref:1-deoxy-D-xylulose 5-phosphate reductoisomerase n=1 Tax=Loktanella gaetbuli TaxID=2881335 RepID=A0ABS8BPY1_9RHOB|nr:1-deoxy-D-xylulose-5-phosphate reductoisomerase [Loktanella gaetbuli]MCB5197786.1 1-deoxy-D-xylulose-5-phosphate reductoisomerase [Loktanella gaetbuli]